MFHGFLRRALLVAPLALAACDTPGRNTTLSLEGRLRLADAMGNGDPEQRLALLRSAGQEARSSAVLAQLAVAAEQAGAHGEAAEALRGLVAIEGPSEARLIAIGRLAMREGDAAGAAQAYQQAVSLNPRSAEGLGGLGLAHDLAGDRAAAQAAYRRGLAVAPASWSLRSNLGVSLVTTGAASDAIVVLSDAEIMASAPAHARHNLALAYVADGQQDRAVRVLRSSMGNAEALTLARELSAFAAWLRPDANIAAIDPAPPRSVGASGTGGSRRGRREGDLDAAYVPPTALPPAREARPAVATSTSVPVPDAPGMPPLSAGTAALAPGQPMPDEIVVTAPPPGPEPSAQRAPSRTRAPSRPATPPEPGVPAAGVPEARAPGLLAPGIVAAQPDPPVQANNAAGRDGAAQVQFLAAGSAAGALAEWARLQSRVPELAERSPMITRFEREGHPTFWRVRAEGFADAAAARSFCAQLRARAVPCMAVTG